MRSWCFALTTAVVLGNGVARAQTHVTCVGDSITFGDGTSGSSKTYPAILQGLLGTSFAVENDGQSGATMLKAGDYPYWTSPKFTTSTAWAGAGGDVVIQLGTNDSKPANWAKKASFEADCEALVDHYRSGGARVWISLIPPAMAKACCKIEGSVIANEVVPLLQQCAATKGASTIDVHAAFTGHSDWLPDGVHPNDAGAELIAQTVHAVLTKQPTIELAVMSSGTTVPAVTLTATPAAAYGTVERVTFLDGTTVVKELTAGPWTASLAGVAPGMHVYTAKMVETAGRTRTSAPAAIEISAPGGGRPRDTTNGNDPGSAASRSAGTAPSAGTRKGGGCAAGPRDDQGATTAASIVLALGAVCARRRPRLRPRCRR